MDNGLIFPYPRECAHAESGDAKHLKPLAYKQSKRRQHLGAGRDGVPFEE